MNGSNEKQMTVPAATQQLNHHADDEIGKSLQPLEPSLDALIGTILKIFIAYSEIESDQTIYAHLVESSWLLIHVDTIKVSAKIERANRFPH